MTLSVLSSEDRETLAELSQFDGFIGFKQSVQERDEHSCALCSFQAKKYQEIALKPDVPISKAINMDSDDWQTICQFCLQTRDITIASDMESGVMLWLPEISQNDLNNLARAIYVARVSQGPMADAARKIMESLMQRREVAKARLGTDDVTMLKNVLNDFLEERHIKAIPDKLDGVRLFPLDRRMMKEGGVDFNQFPQILAYWRSKEGPFGGKLPGTWIENYIKYADKAA